MAADPYKYFRIEARELLDGLTEGVLELEKGLIDQERISGLLRLAHTLKGAARVVKQSSMAELAHDIEDVLAPFREESVSVPKDRAAEMLRILDQLGTGLTALESTAVTKPLIAAGLAGAGLGETVRVEVEEVEALLRQLSEARAELAVLERELVDLRRAKRQAEVLGRRLQGEPFDGGVSARIRSLSDQLLESLRVVDRRWGERLERLQRELGQAGELANRLRLLPSSWMFEPLARVVRDAALALGKRVQLDTAGGDIRLDAHVLMVLRDALLQLLRNAVAHGIEDPGRRTSAGKPAAGRIELRVEWRGERIAVVCQDDGAGIDLAAIRQVAVQKGVISSAKAETLGLGEAIDIIFGGGFSTSVQVNEIAGRGIGLDIVRAAVARLRGEISVRTEPGRMTSVEICVPASLTSVQALTVKSDGVMASLPLDSVRQVLRVPSEEMAWGGENESIPYEGQAIPFLRLSSALGRPEPPEDRRKYCSTVIVTSGSQIAAIGVDKLLGSGHLLVRALPALTPAAGIAKGAILDEEGNPRLFLDPAGLVESARRGERRARLPQPAAPMILVIDDSLTTRMVEQSILESAGYRVDVAISGEEALEKALAQQYALFLVDVEMPGMDGFEFISRTRGHPVLQDVPAILVTSRMSSDDRRRGEEVGARAYIVKSEFDQGYFLQTIERLVR